MRKLIAFAGSVVAASTMTAASALADQGSNRP